MLATPIFQNNNYSLDPTEAEDNGHPTTATNSSDETAAEDEYEQSSSARSMSSLATSVDSEPECEQNKTSSTANDKVHKVGNRVNNVSLVGRSKSPTVSSIETAKPVGDGGSTSSSAATPEYGEYFSNGGASSLTQNSTASTPSTVTGSPPKRPPYPSVLIPNGSTASPAAASTTRHGNNNNNNNGKQNGTVVTSSPGTSPLVTPTTNFARPLRQDGQTSRPTASASASSTSLPLLTQSTSSSSHLSRHSSHVTSSNNHHNVQSMNEVVSKKPTSAQNMPPPANTMTTANTTTRTKEHRSLTADGTTQQGANRASISSQLSNASTRNSIHRMSTATGVGSHHRPSFSFSRRRSMQGQGISNNSSQLDESSVPAQDIERLREALVREREMKRKRREFLDDDKVLIGNKVDENHQNFVTAYNMLTGIRVSVSRCNAKVNHELTDADFKARHKLAFDIGGNELTPSAKYDFKFKDYAPYVFRHLRELFKLDPADYLMSLTSKYIVSELGSPGKSGSFFYFSRDYRFIIKTIHHAEHKMLRKILKDYHTHVKNNPNTLISQFYGLHRVKTPFGRKIHFIVMNNLFPAHRDVHKTYDLKGSTLGRYLPEPKSEDQKRRSVVYKDLNWLKHDERIKLGPKKREEFIKQLEVDVELLKRLNIMDYSLLIGVHDLTLGNKENIRDSTLSVFEPGSGLDKLSRNRVAGLRQALNAASPTALNSVGFEFDKYIDRDQFKFYADSGGFRATDLHDQDLNEIYYLGVIDCLTPYTFSKRVETFWKGLSHTRPSISALPATEYGDRFLSFIKSMVTQKKRNDDEDQGQAEAPPDHPPLSQDESQSPAQSPQLLHLPSLAETSESQPNC